MLAYVFWHWKYPHVERSAYEEYLRNFHQTLQSQKPDGFQSSMVLHAQGVPWIAGKEEVYEDWYLVENSAGLDVLDRAAVNEFRRGEHDRVALWAAGGTGGLYRLYAGEPLAAPHNAFWFAKPTGIKYAAFSTSLEELRRQTPGCLWQRQMTLGPAPEFCWHAPLGATLPDDLLNTLRVPLTAIGNFGF